jgi:hypothetical protein
MELDFWPGEGLRLSGGFQELMVFGGATKKELAAVAVTRLSLNHVSSADPDGCSHSRLARLYPVFGRSCWLKGGIAVLSPHHRWNHRDQKDYCREIEDGMYRGHEVSNPGDVAQPGWTEEDPLQVGDRHAQRHDYERKAETEGRPDVHERYGDSRGYSSRLLGD